MSICSACNGTFKPPSIQLRGAFLWTLTRPSLYVLEVALKAGSTFDGENVTFGARSLHWSAAGGFELNGVPTKILGCANHQDFPAVGVAVPDGIQEHRIRRLKEFGSNAWRTAHNPPNTALLDAADRLGMLIMDENHHNGYDNEMSILVRRDR